MLKSISKKGRPQASYRTTWGERIDGLTRLADGRWKISGPKAIKYTEPDERLAVAQFREHQAKEKGSTIRIPAAGARLDDVEGLRKALRSLPQPSEDHRRMHGTFLPPALMREEPTPEPSQTSETPLRIEVEDDHMMVFRDPVWAASFWAWLRRLILTQKEYVAQMTGISQLAWLTELNKPAASPTAEELINLYATKPGITMNEIGRSKLYWREFTRAINIKTIRELSHDQVAKYEAVIQGGDYAPKSILHRYRKIRTILAYAIKRGRGIEDCRRALDVTAMLDIKETNPLNPRPISVEDFWAIYKEAVDAKDTTFAALMLVALNSAMYGGEVAALKWNEIDLKAGELVTRRPKTKVSRVAVLWPGTIKALRAVPRQGDSVFYTKVRSFTVFSVLDAWRKYRTRSGVGEHVVFSQIRDAGFSIACRVSLDQARILVGHRLPGASDAYLRRNPRLVADACEAIRHEFFGKTAQSRGASPQ